MYLYNFNVWWVGVEMVCPLLLYRAGCGTGSLARSARVICASRAYIDCVSRRVPCPVYSAVSVSPAPVQTRAPSLPKAAAARLQCQCSAAPAHSHSATAV
jgi:hypothetical protein